MRLNLFQYLGDHGNHVPVDISEMALALQAEYRYGSPPLVSDSPPTCLSNPSPTFLLFRHILETLSLCFPCSEYARKKKVAFRNLVAKGELYLSLAIHLT